MTNTLTAEQKLETAIHNAMNDTVHMDDDSENAWQKAVSAIALAVAPFVSPDLPSPPVSGVAAWSLVDPLPTSRGHSFGDWRDIRACLEALVVDYMSLPDDTRDALWKFAEALPKVHPAMTFNCAECGKTFSRIDQYRCADCHATCCENCIRPHFGPEHKPHLSPLTNEPVWLGMTDAPRDGTAILGDVDGSAFVVWWDKMHSGWVSGHTDADDELYTRDVNGWMPLPTPQQEVQP